MPTKRSQIGLSQSEKGTTSRMHLGVPKVNMCGFIADDKQRFTSLNLANFPKPLSKRLQDFRFVKVRHEFENSKTRDS
jgi:hypothetical protein